MKKIFFISFEKFSNKNFTLWRYFENFSNENFTFKCGIKFLYAARYRVLNLGYIIGYKILCRRMLGVIKLLWYAAAIDLDRHIRR